MFQFPKLKDFDLLTTAKWLSALIVIAGVVFAAQNWNDFFVTPDQRAQKLFDEDQFREAAAVYQDPFHKGMALYRNGDFEEAAKVFGGLPGPDAAFNQANSLFMHGQYEQAIKRYDRALVLRKEWPKAITNRDIAIARAEKLKLEGGDMTGGRMGADDYVFDNNPKNNPDEAGEETVEVEAMNDQEMRNVWLRQIETTPRDFLRSKFAYQLATQSVQPENPNNSKSTEAENE